MNAQNELFNFDSLKLISWHRKSNFHKLTDLMNIFEIKPFICTIKVYFCHKTRWVLIYSNFFRLSYYVMKFINGLRKLSFNINLFRFYELQSYIKTQVHLKLISSRSYWGQFVSSRFRFSEYWKEKTGPHLVIWILHHN